jgi:hypothetical protein
LAAVDAALKAAGLGAINVPAADQIELTSAPDSVDLP